MSRIQDKGYRIQDRIQDRIRDSRMRYTVYTEAAELVSRAGVAQRDVEDLECTFGS
jgi:hypothetical protein